MYVKLLMNLWLFWQLVLTDGLSWQWCCSCHYFWRWCRWHRLPSCICSLRSNVDDARASTFQGHALKTLNNRWLRPLLIIIVGGVLAQRRTISRNSHVTFWSCSLNLLRIWDITIQRTHPGPAEAVLPGHQVISILVFYIFGIVRGKLVRLLRTWLIYQIGKIVVSGCFVRCRYRVFLLFIINCVLTLILVQRDCLSLGILNALGTTLISIKGCVVQALRLLASILIRCCLRWCRPGDILYIERTSFLVQAHILPMIQLIHRSVQRTVQVIPVSP